MRFLTLFIGLVVTSHLYEFERGQGGQVIELGAGKTGAGKTGTVYKAHRLSDQIPVAIKRFHPNQKSSFESERSILSQLKHPNIVRLLDSYEDEETGNHLVLEYILGQDGLSLSLGKPIAKNKIPSYIKQLIEALHYLHQHSIVHMDAFPGNFIITPQDELILIDFGTSKAGIGPTSGFSEMGYSIFADPSLIEGKEAGMAIDYYFVATSLYAMWKGAVPSDPRKVYLGYDQTDQLIDVVTQKDMKKRWKQCFIEFDQLIKMDFFTVPVEQFTNRYARYAIIASAVAGGLLVIGVLGAFYYQKRRERLKGNSLI